MPIEKLSFTIPAELSGKRLDQALASLCPQHSRTRLQEWIKKGYVEIDHTIPRAKDIVVAGQAVLIEAEFEPGTRSEAEAIALDIVHEEKEFIVLNKPAGLVVHPGAGNPRHTLLNALLHHAPQLNIVPRAGIVQRLDKDTSGLMVIACTPSTHTYLVDQLQRRLVRRQYQAIVHGVMTAGGTIDAPVGRHRIQRKRMAVTDSGKPAITHYRVLKKFASHTHVQLRLESGRTHQIRVHMAHKRFPVVGDRVYGGRARLPKQCPESLRRLLQEFPRQALHASELGFAHPSSAEPVSFSVPLPEDMQALLQELAHG